MSATYLVLGYGNALRGDDGVGWHAAGLLAEDPRLAGTTVLQRQQLLPELAVEISNAALVVLLDADYGLPAGEISVTNVKCSSQSGTGWSHHFSPGDLLALTRELYGGNPEMLLVSAGIASTEVGDQLSPAVAAALPHLTEVVADLVSFRSKGLPASAPWQGSHA